MRRTPASLLVVGVLALSAGLHWLAVRGIHGPWIVPDEMIYADRALTVWRDGPWSLLHGAGAGYGLLYPFVAGVPLSIGRTTQAYSLLKVAQPVIASLAVVPVFVGCRRLMPVRWALLAAVLTAASPLVLYSGFVMTEVLFYPLAALTLFVVARAVETASLRDQALVVLLVAAAVLTRSQAVVFALVPPSAVLLEAVMARDPRRLRRFWPSAVVLVAGALTVVVVPGLVGAYGQTMRGGYSFGLALGLVVEHLALVAIVVAVAPFAALVVVLQSAFRGAERDPGVRALTAVTLATTLLLVLQVGFFAARYSPHLLGRDLTPLPPLLFSIFALWLSRGAPRRLLSASLCVYAVLALLVLMPWDRLVTPVAFADTFDLILISKLPVSPLTSAIAFSLAVLTAFVVLPRRVTVVVLPLVTLATLVASSAVAARNLESAAGVRRLDIVGPVPDWIDHATSQPVALVYGGEQLWSGVWQERFWNRRVDQVITLGGTPVPGPLPQTEAKLPVEGTLPTRDRFVVAPDRFTLVGRPVAHLAQAGLDITGLTLWRTSGAPRVSTITNGVQPNGDMTQPATVSVYGCTRGSLELTLIPKATGRLKITVDGRIALDRPLSGLSWTGSVPVPPSRRPRTCTFTIFPAPLLGSTRIAFVR